MDIGVVILLDTLEMEKKFKKAAEEGFGYCQLVAWHPEFLTEEMACTIDALCKKYAVRISTYWAGWFSGGGSWDFVNGPETLGIVPPALRTARIKELKQGMDFAHRLGVRQVATHLGFVPESMKDPLYAPLVEAVRELADYAKERGELFLFETGQETPVTLLRLIEDSERDNLGLNLDPANLILYGKANPSDALTVFGRYVRDVHGKDGCYPTNGRQLGKEMPLGEGMVNFPAFVGKLKEVGYDGTIIIEREITGPQQEKDIRAAKKLLEELI